MENDERNVQLKLCREAFEKYMRETYAEKYFERHDDDDDSYVRPINDNWDAWKTAYQSRTPSIPYSEQVEKVARVLVKEDNRGTNVKEYADYWQYCEDKYKLKYFRMAKAALAALGITENQTTYNPPEMAGSTLTYKDK